MTFRSMYNYFFPKKENVTDTSRTELRLKSVPKMRLEVMERFEFLSLLGFVLAWYITLMLILLTAPSWTVVDYAQDVAYCTVQQDNHLKYLYAEDCDMVCWFRKESASLISNYVRDELRQCEIDLDDADKYLYPNSSTFDSCPYDGAMLLSEGIVIAGPNLEITFTSFNNFYPLLGTFDTYLTVTRRLADGYRGEPYKLQFSYTLVAGGKRLGMAFNQMKTLYDGSVDVECEGGGHPCRFMMLPYTALRMNLCADLSDFSTMELQIFYHHYFSPLQPSLNVTSVGQSNVTSTYTDIALNDVVVSYKTTSRAFMDAMAGAHLFLVVVLGTYFIFYLIVTKRYLTQSSRHWFVERKWSIVQNGFAIIVGGDILYFFLIAPFSSTGDSDNNTSTSYSSALKVADQFLVNFSMGVILAINLCFLANFRNTNYSEGLSLKFYADKFIFLGIWTIITICGTIVTFMKAHNVFTNFKVSDLRTAGTILTYVSIVYYYISFIFQLTRTSRRLKGNWNFGVRHRQLGFRFNALLQFLGLSLYITENGLVQLIWPNRISVLDYESYTGYGTLFVDTFAFNIYTVVTVVANTWCYLPPGKQPKQNEIEASVMTASTHVKARFSLYTAHWMVGCSSIAYRDPPGTIHSERGVLDVDKYGITLLHFISVKETDIHCVVFKQDEELVISFRGTASKENALTDLQADLVAMCWQPGSVGKHSCPKGSHCRAENLLVHRGFMIAYTSIRETLFEKIRPVMNKLQVVAMNSNSTNTRSHIPQRTNIAMNTRVHEKLFASTPAFVNSAKVIKTIVHRPSAVVQDADEPTHISHAYPEKHTGDGNESLEHTQLHTLTSLPMDSEERSSTDSRTCTLLNSSLADAQSSSIQSITPTTPTHKHAQESSHRSIDTNPLIGAAQSNNSQMDKNTQECQMNAHVFVTGHSLGAALATLFSHECASVYPWLTQTVYTFGSPRVANRKFAEKYNTLVPYTYRLCNDGDLVTGVPKFRGPEFMNMTYKHVGTHYVLSSLGDLIVNPSFMERLLKVKVRYNPNSHVTASYRNSIAACIGTALRQQNREVSHTLATAMEILNAVLQAPSHLCKHEDIDQDAGQAWAAQHSSTHIRQTAQHHKHGNALEGIFSDGMMSVRRRVSYPLSREVDSGSSDAYTRTLGRSCSVRIVSSSNAHTSVSDSIESSIRSVNFGKRGENVNENVDVSVGECKCE
eukprot:CFRG2269T1